MNKLIAAAALAVPLVVATPAQATHGGWHTKTCWKTEDGQTLRVKMRFEDETVRIRVSHPRGTGRFFSDDVLRTRVHYGFEGIPYSDGKISLGGGVGQDYFNNRSKPVYVTSGQPMRGTHTVNVRFKMDDGSFRYVNCTESFR